MLARTGTGTAADEVFTEAAGGSPDGFEGNQSNSDDEDATTGGGVGASVGSGERTAGRRPADVFDDEVPELVEGCNDEDTVARQLCELATEEEDPILRETLWDEYNEYVKIIARQ